jgi:molecular chaperone GrpE (heat shock protein)
VNFPADPDLPATSAESDLSDLSDQSDESDLSDWKDALRRDFEEWLASLDAIPAPDDTLDDGGDTPDLFSFYEQFAAANAEARKSNRRTAEAFSQWSETLGRFETSLAPLREISAQLAAQPKDTGLARAHCLLLVELLDRMHRLARAYETPPAVRKSWWGGRGDEAWQKAWASQRQALDILVSHLEGLLKKEGVTRIETTGQPFDPTLMLAVSAEPDASRPAQTVLEELTAGYRRHGELLRAAQVKVSRQF